MSSLQDQDLEVYKLVVEIFNMLTPKRENPIANYDRNDQKETKEDLSSLSNETSNEIEERQISDSKWNSQNVETDLSSPSPLRMDNSMIDNRPFVLNFHPTDNELKEENLSDIDDEPQEELITKQQATSKFITDVSNNSKKEQTLPSSAAKYNDNKQNMDMLDSIDETGIIEAEKNIEDDTKANDASANDTEILHEAPPYNRLNRCNTSLLLLEDDDKDDDDNTLQYGFGVPFSYWTDWTFYPYIAPKYKSLKEELLQNNHFTIKNQVWENVYKKGEEKLAEIHEILGQNGDLNTAFAKSDKQWNRVTKIEPDEKIDLDHLLSILFYTDLTDLQSNMKNVCRITEKGETRQDVAKRHCEMAVWLRLMFETIVLYGGRLSVNDDLKLYHGLNRKFYFPQYKCKFFIPTSTSREKTMAQKYATQNGITLEFSGMETRGDPYFATESISDFPHERELFFFFADLPIKALYTTGSKFDMTPLSLYQSIINGNIIIDKHQNDKKKFQKAQKSLEKLLDEIDNMDKIELDDEEQDVQVYGKYLLQRYQRSQKEIRINKDEIIAAIKLPKLKKRFIEQNEDKTFKDYSQQLLDLQSEQKISIKNTYTFKWNLTDEQINQFLEGKGISSKAYKCWITSGESQYKIKFYFQMNKRNENQGKILLILYELPEQNVERTVIINFDVFCKSMKKYYAKFHDIKLKLCDKDDKDDQDGEHKERQGIEFDLQLIKDRKKPIEWEFSVSFINDGITKTHD